MNLFRYDVDIINDTMTVPVINSEFTYGTISYYGDEQTRICDMYKCIEISSSSVRSRPTLEHECFHFVCPP